MISPDEFLRRCEQVRAEFAVEVTKRQQLTRELAALCALTGARAESLCDHNSQLTGLRVSDPGGNLVISGPVDEVLAELVAMPVSYQNRGPSPGARHRTRSPETVGQPTDPLVAMPASYQNRGPGPDARHRTLSSETAGYPAGQLVAGNAVPDAVRLDLVGIDESGKARGRWTSRVRSRGLSCRDGEGGEAPVSRTPQDRLADIRDSAVRAQRAVDALQRAAAADLLDQEPNVPWSEVAGMRDLLAHQVQGFYDGTMGIFPRGHRHMVDD